MVLILVLILVLALISITDYLQLPPATFRIYKYHAKEVFI